MEGNGLLHRGILEWEVVLGAISSLTLPLDSLVSLQTAPSARLISLLGSFGAGALIATLSVELVAPTLFELDHWRRGALGPALVGSTR
jgi:hypothetical protein